VQSWLQTYIDVKLIPVYFLLYVAYRNRKAIGNFFRSWQHTFQQLASAISNGSDCLVKATYDLKSYLQGNSSEEVPASFIRLVRLFSSPEFVVILRNISSGAAQGVCREIIARDSENRKKGTNVTGKGPNERVAALVKLLEAFTTPSGERLVSLVISTTVREGLSAVFDRYDREAAYALKKRRNGNNRVVEVGGGHNKEQTDDFPPVVKALLDMAVSDEGRKFMIDLAVAVTATAVPLAMKNFQKRPPTAKVEPTPKADSVQLTPTTAKTVENNQATENLSSPTKKHEKSSSFILPFFRKQNAQAAVSNSVNNSEESQTKRNDARPSRGTSAPGFLDKAAKFFGRADGNKCQSQEKKQNDCCPQNPVTNIETGGNEIPQPSIAEKLAQTLLKDHDLLKELTKTASFEVVRSYLLTSSELDSQRTKTNSLSIRSINFLYVGTLLRKLLMDLYFQWLRNGNMEPQWLFW